MSVPGNINPAPPPSSFDNDSEFYEESRWKKLRRRLIEEPLIPLGCALTCWALYEASSSIKTGNKARTNRMFRRRIYAQGFTIAAMLAGSIYWSGDRGKRKEYQGLLDEKKRKEKHENWLRELEARDEEEQGLRRMMRERIGEGQKREVEREVKKEVGQPKGGLGTVRSALEEGEARRRPILRAVADLWDRTRG